MITGRRKFNFIHLVVHLHDELFRFSRDSQRHASRLPSFTNCAFTIPRTETRGAHIQP